MTSVTVPDLAGRARRSPWVSACPGLARAVSEWEHDLAGARLVVRAGPPQVARPGLVPPVAAARRGAALLSGPLRWASRRLPGDLLAGRPLSQPGAWLQESAGYLLREQLAILGPIGAELSGVFSLLDGLLPELLLAELRRRPVRANPLPLHAVRRTAEGALPGAFASIGPRLSATPASQLHTAELRDGSRVLLRVADPHAGRAVREDATMAANVVAALEQAIPAVRVVQPMGILEVIFNQLAAATDLRNQALDMTEIGMAAETLGVEGVTVCRPLPGLVTRLAAAFEHPRPADELVLAKLTAGQAAHLARLTLESALGLGVFDADLGPEHLLGCARGGVALAGCGAAGFLDLATRRAALDFAAGLLSGDAPGQAAALADLEGAPALPTGSSPGPPRGRRAEELATELEAIKPPDPMSVLTAAGGLSGYARDLAGVLARRRFVPPLEIVQLARAVMSLRGVLRDAEPGVSLLAAVLPVALRVPQWRAELQ